MSEVDAKELLKKREVLAEIDRHKWFASEKAGYDIGFEAAAEDWLKNFSAAWMAYNMPAQSEISSAPVSESSIKSKRRKAKSYIQA